MTNPQEIVAGLATKADKIRALDAAGYSRADIARHLGIRYQHVRNTLVRGAPAKSSAKPNTKSRPIITPDPQPIEKLTSAGFTLLGECVLEDPQSFSYRVKAPTDPGVYAFAVNGFTTYVGLTRHGLRTRLGHYVYGHKGQKTSSRVKGLILTALNAGNKVEVLIAQPPKLTWNGLPVDGASGLETGLIRMLQPEWNLQGSRRG